MYPHLSLVVVSIALALVLLGVVVVMVIVGSYCYRKNNNMDEEKQTTKGTTYNYYSLLSFITCLSLQICNVVKAH